MRYIAMLILAVLLSATANGQTLFSNDASQIRQFITAQAIGQRLNVYPNKRGYLSGTLVRVGEEDFEIAIGKRLEKIPYSTVPGVAVIEAIKGTEKKRKFLTRVGGAFQTSLAVAAIGTLFIASYPTTTLAGRSADAKADALRKEIASTLPQGSSKAQVLNFLDSRKIVHDDLHIVTSHYSYPAQENIRLISASIPRPNRFSFFEYQIDITFRFDEAEHLIDSKVGVTAGGL